LPEIKETSLLRRHFENYLSSINS
ncbi:MAG: metal-dependent phosphohydrolase, partial [Methanosarcina mazei]